MKKILSVILCVSIVCCFYACSKSKNEPEFTENSASTTIGADDVENTNVYTENTAKIIRNINSVIDKMEIKNKDNLSDKDINLLAQQVNGTCTKKDSKANTYRFIVGSTVEFKLDVKNKQITFYVDDELYAQRNLQ